MDFLILNFELNLFHIQGGLDPMCIARPMFAVQSNSTPPTDLRPVELHMQLIASNPVAIPVVSKWTEVLFLV